MYQERRCSEDNHNDTYKKHEMLDLNAGTIICQKDEFEKIINIYEIDTFKNGKILKENEETNYNAENNESDWSNHDDKDLKDGGICNYPTPAIIPTQSIDNDDKVNWKENYDDFKIIDRIGKGSSGNVDTIKNIKSGHEFILKTINISNLQEAENEIKVMSHLRQLISQWQKYELKSAGFYPGYPILRHVNFHANKVELYMEKIKSNLFSIDLKQFAEKFNFLSKQQTQHIFRRIIKSLKTLHEVDVIHEDIKPQNIIISDRVNDNNLTVTLIDYGLSQFKFKRSESYDKGTTLYSSPEKICGEVNIKRSSDVEKIDIWAVGISFLIVRLGLFGNAFKDDGNCNPFKCGISGTNLTMFIGSFLCKCRCKILDNDAIYNDIETMRTMADDSTLKILKRLPHVEELDCEELHFIKYTLGIMPQSRYNADQLLKHTYLSNDVAYEFEFEDYEMEND